MNKVLFLGTDLFSVGGIQRYSNYQLRALKESGYDVVALSLHPPSKSFFRETSSVAFHSTGATLIGKLYFCIMSVFYILQFRPHFVISAHIGFSILVSILKLFSKATFILNVYGLEIWSRPKKIISKRLNCFDKIIGDCNFIISYVLPLTKKNKLYLLYDPVDEGWVENETVNYRKPKSTKFTESNFKILTVGRLERKKGHFEILSILGSLPSNIVYQVVGEGHLRKTLEKLVAIKGLQSRVEFLGRQTDRELARFYQFCDVVILISSVGDNEGEGLPMGAIEGSGFGKPVIVGDQDGSRDAISKTASNGFLITPGDDAQLKEAIINYYTDKNLKMKHGNAGRTYSINTFGFKKFTKNLLEILENEKN